MPSTLDDVVAILTELHDVMVEVRDAVETSGKGASQTGPSGSKSSGGGGGGMLSNLAGMTSKKGMLKGLGKLGGPLAAIGAAEQIADFTGLTRGARGLNLGFGAAGAAGSMQRTFAGNVAGMMPFGEAIFANTTQTLSELDRSQSSVSGIAEQVARAGGSLSRGGIKEALRRQNEIEGRVSGARNLTEEMQGELVTEEGKVGGAVAKDLGLGALIAAIEKLTDAFASRGGGATGGGR